MVPGSDTVWMPQYRERRRLGGIEQSQELDDLVRSYRVTREGCVEATVVYWDKESAIVVPVEWLVAMVACVVGVYDRLRGQAGAPSMPAEVGIEVLTRGTSIVSRVGSQRGHTALEPTTTFPSFSVSDLDSFSEVINAVAGDLVNASGLSVDVLPKFQLTLT
jgi:hypothetical protein